MTERDAAAAARAAEMQQKQEAAAVAERVADLEPKVDFFFNHVQSVPNAAALLTEAVNELQAVEMNYPRYVNLTKQLENNLGGSVDDGERLEIYQMTLDRIQATVEDSDTNLDVPELREAA